MNLRLLIITLIFSLNSFGQTNSKKELKYHPKTFEESLAQLDKIFPDSTKNKIKNMSESDFIGNSHFGVARWIRNEWLYDRYFFKLIIVKSDLREELIAGVYQLMMICLL